MDLSPENLLPFCYHNTLKLQKKPATKRKYGSRFSYRFLYVSAYYLILLAIPFTLTRWKSLVQIQYRLPANSRGYGYQP